MRLNKYLPPNFLHRVKQKETLNDILSIYNTDINNVKIFSVNELKEGEFVKIVKTNKYFHVVKPVETLSTIAKFYNVKKEDIILNNGLTGENLFIGQILRF